MKQRNMLSICDQFCPPMEKQTDRLGQTYLYVHQFYAFGGHIDVNLHMQSWGMVIFISLESHTKGMHYATFQ